MTHSGQDFSEVLMYPPSFGIDLSDLPNYGSPMSSKTLGDKLNRRKVVESLATVGLVSLAGCSGNGNGGGDDGSGGNGNGGGDDGSGGNGNGGGDDGSGGGGSGNAVANMWPTSGPASLGGENCQLGAELRFEELQNNGGIDGVDLDVLYRNTECNPDVSTSITQNLLSSQDNLAAWIGGYCSPDTLSTMDMTRENDVAQIVTSFAPAVTQGDHPYIFRCAPNSEITTDAGVSYAIEQGAETFAVMGINNDWGQAEISAWEARVEEAGKELVFSQEVPTDQPDYNNQISLLRSESPDAAYFAGYANHVNSFINQAADQGMNFNDMVMYTAAEAKPITQDLDSRQVAEGSYTYTYFILPAYDNYPDSATDAMVEFVDLWQENRDQPILREHATGYTCAHIAIEGIREAGSAEGPAIAEALHGMEEPMETPLGPITFDENGQGDLQLAVARFNGPDSIELVTNPWE
jgi:branched-chain amino acid transport system substrate-binding protein